MQECKDYDTQDIATMKQNQAEILEMMDTMWQIKSSVESLHNGMNEAEKRITEL